MSSIGPQIPAHLLQQLNRSDDNGDDNSDDDGPQPSNPSLINDHKVSIYDDDDDDEGPQPSIGPTIGPAMPPTVSKTSKEQEPRGDGPSLPSHSRSSKQPSPETSASESKRVLGPSFPSYAPTYNANAYLDEDDDDDDDDFGPKPLPAGMQHEQRDAVKDFMEKEEKRKKAAEDASKPKAPKRDEWMLVPPTTSGLLGNLDPTKLKGRQFSRGTAAPANNDTSLWTETPAERQQRLADEVSGKKRRITEAPIESEDEVARKRRRKQEEEAIRKGVDQHTRSKRGGALVDQHADTLLSKPTDSGPPVIWDHSRDMGLGGRLMDDDKRSKMLQEAKGLGDRFGSGRSGGFL